MSSDLSNVISILNINIMRFKKISDKDWLKAPEDLKDAMSHYWCSSVPIPKKILDKYPEYFY